MALSPPSIVGVLSTLNVSARVQGQITGSTVELLRNGTERIAHHPDSMSDQVIAFEPGITLQSGDEITAIQHYGGQESKQTPIPTLVQELVPPFGGHCFISHVFRCGTSLFLAGIVPGAEVHLSVGSDFRGKAVAVDGSAVVHLAFATGNKESLEARQFVQGTFSPPVPSPPADPPPDLRWFRVDTPKACMPGIFVHNVVDGAEVSVLLQRGDPQSQWTFRVPVRSQFLRLPELKPQQELAVQERMERCEIWSPELNPDVQPMTFYTRPSVKGPLCAGTKRIEVHNLVPGVIVTAAQGDTTVGMAEATDVTLDMWVEPLGGGVPLVVTETLCGVSSSSYPEDVTTVPAVVPQIRLVEPLFACAMEVSLESVYPGSWVCAMSAEQGQISQWRRIAGSEGVLQLDSPLQQGHHIKVLQSACGGPPSESNEEPVEHTPYLKPPHVEGPVYVDHPVVQVSNAIPGALVQLYSRESGFISAATADKDGRAVLPKTSIYATAHEGHHVWARQMLCHQITEFGNVERVVDRTPYAPILTEPLAGQTGVYQRPMLRWKDPGAGTFRQASLFRVELTHAGNPTFSDPLLLREFLSGTDQAVNFDLALGEQVIWRVTPFVGSPGFEVSGPTSTSNFTVALPPEPPPQLTFSKVAIYNCHSHLRKVKIYKADLTEGDDWDAVGELGAQYAGGNCPTAAATPLEIDLEDGHDYIIVAVDVGMPGCTGDNPMEPACVRNPPLSLPGSDSGPVLRYAIDFGPVIS